MRNVIFAINITLDGCCDHTKQSVDEEKLEYFTHLTREADAQVFGRKTYQLMVPYWPEILKNQSETKADTEFAREADCRGTWVSHRLVSKRLNFWLVREEVTSQSAASGRLK
jgi:dihydrofolate reductase